MKNQLETFNFLRFLIFHPFKGFWDLKKERTNKITIALVLLALLFFFNILKHNYTGYLFNYKEIKDLNILLEAAKVILPFVLWSASNWCVTSLMDGEGSMKEIMIYSSVSLIPMIIFILPMIIVSNIVNLSEIEFYLYFNSLAVMWSGLLLFIGTMTIHQYSFKKTIQTIVLTIVGMGVIVFISVLFLNLINEVIAFFISVYREITFRI